MKKTLSFLLALLTAMSIGTAAIAAENEQVITNDSVYAYDVSEGTDYSVGFSETENDSVCESVENISDNDEVKADESGNDPDCFIFKDPDEPVAIMYLCATAHSLTGHVWLYFENTSDEDIKVGYVTLAPGEKTSVGSLRNTRTNGGGTYYNGEAYMSKNIDVTGEHTTYLSMNLDKSQLETVSGQIKKRNMYNMLFWNCGNFATAVWNSVSTHHFVHICFPVFTIMQMAVCGAKKGFTMSRPSIDKCFKQTENGVVPAQASSFNTTCV